MALRLGERRRGTKRRHGSREGTGREQTGRKKYVIYLRERGREKTPLGLANTHRQIIYIVLNIVAWWLFIALSFIY